MKEYNLWMQGYRVTGGSGKARQIGTVSAESFRSACIEFSKTEEAKGYGAFDADKLSFWACRLFDNEAEARKFCG